MRPAEYGRLSDAERHFGPIDPMGPDVLIYPDEVRRGPDGHRIPSGSLATATRYLGRARYLINRIGDPRIWNHIPDEPVTWYRIPTWQPMASGYMTLDRQILHPRYSHTSPYILYDQIVEPFKNYIPTIIAQIPQGPIPGDVKVICTPYVDIHTNGEITMMASKQDASMPERGDYPNPALYEPVEGTTLWDLSPPAFLRIAYTLPAETRVPFFDIYYGQSTIDPNAKAAEDPRLVYAVTVHPFFRNEKFVKVCRTYGEKLHTSGV